MSDSLPKTGGKILSENTIISITTIGIIIIVLGLVVGLSIDRKCYNVIPDIPDTSPQRSF